MAHKTLPFRLVPPEMGTVGTGGPTGPCYEGEIMVPFYTCDGNGVYVLDYGVPETGRGGLTERTADGECGCLAKLKEAFAAGYKLGRSS